MNPGPLLLLPHLMEAFFDVVFLFDFFNDLLKQTVYISRTIITNEVLLTQKLDRIMLCKLQNYCFFDFPIYHFRSKYSVQSIEKIKTLSDLVATCNISLQI